MLIAGGTEIQLTKVSDFRAERHTDYGIVNGWVASRMSKRCRKPSGLRYFIDGTRLMPVSSASGKSYLLDGTWYLVIGRSLLAVDTN